MSAFFSGLLGGLGAGLREYGDGMRQEQLEKEKEEREMRAAENRNALALKLAKEQKLMALELMPAEARAEAEKERLKFDALSGVRAAKKEEERNAAVEHQSALAKGAAQDYTDPTIAQQRNLQRNEQRADLEYRNELAKKLAAYQSALSESASNRKEKSEAGRLANIANNHGQLIIEYLSAPNEAVKRDKALELTKAGVTSKDIASLPPFQEPPQNFKLEKVLNKDGGEDLVAVNPRNLNARLVTPTPPSAPNGAAPSGRPQRTLEEVVSALGGSGSQVANPLLQDYIRQKYPPVNPREAQMLKNEAWKELQATKDPNQKRVLEDALRALGV